MRPYEKFLNAMRYISPSELARQMARLMSETELNRVMTYIFTSNGLNRKLGLTESAVACACVPVSLNITITDTATGDVTNEDTLAFEVIDELANTEYGSIPEMLNSVGYWTGGVALADFAFGVDEQGADEGADGKAVVAVRSDDPVLIRSVSPAGRYVWYFEVGYKTIC